MAFTVTGQVGEAVHTVAAFDRVLSVDGDVPHDDGSDEDPARVI